jgi:phosphatidate cytidylyltransferase
MFKDLAKRSIPSLIAIVVATLLLTFARYPFVGLIIVAIIATLAALGIKEYIELIKNKGVLLNVSVMLVSAVLFIVLSAFSHGRNLSLYLFGRTPLFLVFILPLLVAFKEHLKEPNDFSKKISFSLLGMVYIVLPLSFILPLLYFPFLDGRLLIAWIIAATKGSDIFAYFSGRLFGKHKLAPIASPNKSWEGALGGILGAMLISLAFAFIPSFGLKTIHAIVGGAILGIGGQFGDLFESLLKRDANIKDSSHLPGLGGILDSLDSLLFNLALAYFFFIASPL